MRRQVRRRSGLLVLSLVAVSGWLLGVVWETVAPHGSDAPQGWPVRVVPRLEGPLDVLVMATDVSYDWHGGKPTLSLGGNTDTMLLVRLDAARGQIRVLSIPRDTRVPIRGHGVFKINAANPYGGPALSMETVATLTGVPVKRYVIFNPQAVITLVDALGGVDLDVPRAMNYDDHTGHLHIHLSPGLQHLDGQAAHDFLRFRHDDQGDIGRVQRQQTFLLAMVKQYLTPANLLATPRLLALARENLASNLSRQEWVSVAALLRGFRRDAVRTAMVPGREAIIRGGWYWQVDDTALVELMDGFYLAKTATQPDVSASPRHDP